jgi:uncharacterized protein
MKRAHIIHCWEGYPNYCWYPQTKKELEEKDFVVEVPEMPETDLPKLSLWLPKMVEVIGTPDEEVVLIGHSIGSVTILRYLESLSEDQRVGTVVLVAGFTHDLGFEELNNFFQTPLDLEKIKTKASRFVLIHSDDDPYVPITEGELLKEKLGAQLIVKHAMKHFSGPVDNEESCISLPDVTNAILHD